MGNSVLFTVAVCGSTTTVSPTNIWINPISVVSGTWTSSDKASIPLLSSFSTANTECPP